MSDAKPTARARALDLARKQVEDVGIRAVLTTEGLGSRDANAKLVERMVAELADARESGRALLAEKMYDEAHRSNDGKSWRALEWLSQQYLGHRAGGQAEEIRKLLDEFKRLKPDELIARLEALVREKGLRVAS